MRKVYHVVQLPLFPPTTKVCKKCLIEKPLTDFYENTDFKDGHTTRCKKCLTQQSSDNYWKTHERPRQSTPGMKMCNRCNIEKPFAAFNKHLTAANGLNPACKQCQSERGKEKRQERGYKRLPISPAVNGGQVCYGCRIEKPFTEYSRETRRKSGYSATCKECLYKAHRATYAAIEDKTAIHTQRQRWYKENQKYHRGLMLKWYRENSLKANEAYRRYVARKKLATVEVVSYERVLERDGNYCYICNGGILPHYKIDFDHVIPLSRGGAHSEENIRVTHASCNRRKRDRLLEEMTPFQRRGVQ